MSINLNFHICLNTAKEWKNSNNEVGKPKQHEPKQQKKKKKKIIPTKIKPIFVLISKQQHTQTAKISKYSNGQIIQNIEKPKTF